MFTLQGVDGVGDIVQVCFKKVMGVQGQPTFVEKVRRYLDPRGVASRLRLPSCFTNET